MDFNLLLLKNAEQRCLGLLSFIPGEAALLVREDAGRALVVADLHLGFERELATMGVNAPSQTGKLLKRLTSLLERVRPTRLLILGDVKHAVPRITEQEWFDVPDFFEKLSKLSLPVEVVPGNHDGDLEPLLPRSVVLHDARGVLLKSKRGLVGLFHGHAWPSRDLLQAKILVMAHSHPVVELRDPLGFKLIEPVWVTAKVRRGKLKGEYFKRRGQRFKELKARTVIVMPAFNRLLFGKPINSVNKPTLLGPFFDAEAVNLDDADIYLQDGTYLGKLRNLVIPF